MTKQRAVHTTDDDAVTLALIAQQLNALERASRERDRKSEERHKEAVGLLRAMNSRTAKLETSVAVIDQWKQGHKEVHDSIDETLKSTISRVWQIGVADGILAAVAALIGIFK